jgi:hypothetical protein
VELPLRGNDFLNFAFCTLISDFSRATGHGSRATGLGIKAFQFKMQISKIKIVESRRVGMTSLILRFAFLFLI